MMNYLLAEADNLGRRGDVPVRITSVQQVRDGGDLGIREMLDRYMVVGCLLAAQEKPPMVNR